MLLEVLKHTAQEYMYLIYNVSNISYVIQLFMVSQLNENLWFYKGIIKTCNKNLARLLRRYMLCPLTVILNTLNCKLYNFKVKFH